MTQLNRFPVYLLEEFTIHRKIILIILRYFLKLSNIWNHFIILENASIVFGSQYTSLCVLRTELVDFFGSQYTSLLILRTKISVCQTSLKTAVVHGCGQDGLANLPFSKIRSSSAEIEPPSLKSKIISQCKAELFVFPVCG